MKTFCQLIRMSIGLIRPEKTRHRGHARYAPVCSPLEIRVSLSQLASARIPLDAAPKGMTQPAIVSTGGPTIRVTYQADQPGSFGQDRPWKRRS